MVNLDLLFAIIFYGLLLLWFFKQRNKFDVQMKVVALYRTKIGIPLMDKLARLFPRFINIVGHVGTVVGFLGMAMIFYFLIKGTFDLLFVPDAPPAVAPVLPGVRIPGLPVLSFWHWIIGIFFVATVHEFFHGIWARLYNLKIKSSGFLFLGPILGAFVEPDEKQMIKKPKKQQLAIFAAGPFANMVFGFLFLLLMNFGTAPLYTSLYEGTGIEVNEIIGGYPAESAGMEAPVLLTVINGKPTTNLGEFINATRDIHPNDEVMLTTDKGEFKLKAAKNPDNESKGFIGIADFSLKTKVKDAVAAQYGMWFPATISWIHLLVFWLVIINFGIGLFNLLPLGPFDGGRMFLTAMQVIFKDQQKALRVWGFISFLGLALIIINLAPYLWKLLLWILKPLMMVGTFLG